MHRGNDKINLEKRGMSALPQDLYGVIAGKLDQSTLNTFSRIHRANLPYAKSFHAALEEYRKRGESIGFADILLADGSYDQFPVSVISFGKCPPLRQYIKEDQLEVKSGTLLYELTWLGYNYLYTSSGILVGDNLVKSLEETKSIDDYTKIVVKLEDRYIHLSKSPYVYRLYGDILGGYAPLVYSEDNLYFSLDDIVENVNKRDIKDEDRRMWISRSVYPIKWNGYDAAAVVTVNGGIPEMLAEIYVVKQNRKLLAVGNMYSDDLRGQASITIDPMSELKASLRKMVELGQIKALPFNPQKTLLYCRGGPDRSDVTIYAIGDISSRVDCSGTLLYHDGIIIGDLGGRMEVNNFTFVVPQETVFHENNPIVYISDISNPTLFVAVRKYDTDQNVVWKYYSINFLIGSEWAEVTKPDVEMDPVNNILFLHETNPLSRVLQILQSMYAAGSLILTGRYR